MWIPGVSNNGVLGTWEPASINQSGIYVFTPYADQCSEIVTIEIKVMTYPKFFTPNGDSYNDYWSITGFSKEHQAKIEIFDRYGKLLRRLKVPGSKWDGTYKGKNMPTNDYWFKVLYKMPKQNGGYVSKEFTSNFTLKR